MAVFCGMRTRGTCGSADACNPAVRFKSLSQAADIVEEAPPEVYDEVAEVFAKRHLFPRGDALLARGLSNALDPGVGPGDRI